jgi:hypothetical protein
VKNKFVTKFSKEPRTWADSLDKRPKREKIDMRFGELHDLYSLPSIIRIIKARRVRWAGHVPRMGEKRNVYKLLVGKPEGRRPLGRPRRRWLDNIRMDL